MITTHADLVGERLGVEGLEAFAASVNNNYLPFTNDHDIRNVPMGRVASATIEQLEDGEFAVNGIIEVFDKNDTLASSRGDGRRIPAAREDIPTFHVGYDRSYNTPEGQALLAALKQLSPESDRTVEVKKSIDPLSTLTISMYIGGAIAAGALAKLGEDLYVGLKNILKNFFASPTLKERLLDFEFTTIWGGDVIEIHVLLTNPTPEDLEALFASRFEAVDAFLSLCQTGQDWSRFVFEYRSGQLRSLYILRGDCVPLKVRSDNRNTNQT